MIKKIIYDLIKCFNDIKKYENIKTLHSDKEIDLNKEMLLFMINNK